MECAKERYKKGLTIEFKKFQVLDVLLGMIGISQEKTFTAMEQGPVLNMDFAKGQQDDLRFKLVKYNQQKLNYTLNLHFHFLKKNLYF